MKKVRDSIRVLLCDDSLMILTVTKDMLQNLGCIVYTADSGKIALRKLKKNQYDLILLDNQLGDTTGKHVIKSYRKFENKNFNNKRTPAICISSTINSANEQEFLDAGFDYCVQKPVSEDTLREILKYLMGK